MRVARPALPHAWLCAFAACCAASLALAFGSGLAWLLMLIPLAALWVSVPLPRLLMDALPWVTRAGALAVIFAGLILSIYPVAPEKQLFAVVGVVAHLLLACAGLILAARLARGGGPVPALIGVLTGALMPPEPAGLRAVAAAAFAFLVVWLIGADDEGKRVPRPRIVPAVIFVAIAVGALVAVARLLPWAQPQVEMYAARMISNDLAVAGLSTESRLGEVEQLALSKRIALRYYADRPDNLRVRAFTAFDGRAWKSDARLAKPLVEVPASSGRWALLDQTPGRLLGVPGVEPPSSARAARVLVRSPERGALPAPAHTTVVKVDGLEVEQTPTGVFLPAGRAAAYAILFADQDPAEPAPGPDMLATPAHVDPRLKDLAASLSAEGRSPAEIVERVSAHFQSGFRYSLNVGAFRSSDPLAEFLFDKKQGYCEYFASASTLMLRLAGVPARYVTGYAVRSFHRSGDHYVVRDSDAHAWTEAYLEGRGWVEVDATPPGDYEAVHGSPRNGGLLASLGALYDEVAALLAQGGVAGLLRGLGRAALAHPVPLALILAAVAVFRLRHRFRRRAGPEARGETSTSTLALTPAMRDLLRGLDAFLAQRGSPRRPSRAPREHVLDPEVAMDEDERSICLRAVDLLYSSAYGGRPENATLVSAVMRDLSTQKRNQQ